MQEPGQFPGPLKELDFWNERAVNLSSIHQQLSSDRIHKVVKVLELAKSTYYPAFNRCAFETAADGHSVLYSQQSTYTHSVTVCLMLDCAAEASRQPDLCSS